MEDARVVYVPESDSAAYLQKRRWSNSKIVMANRTCRAWEMAEEIDDSIDVINLDYCQHACAEAFFALLVMFRRDLIRDGTVLFMTVSDSSLSGLNLHPAYRRSSSDLLGLVQHLQLLCQAHGFRAVAIPSAMQPYKGDSDTNMISVGFTLCQTQD